MKKIITIVLLCVSILSVDAQVDKLAGPRVGITMVQAGSLASLLRKDVPFFPMMVNLLVEMNGLGQQENMELLCLNMDGNGKVVF